MDSSKISPIRWENESLFLIDQTRLPEELIIIQIQTLEEAEEAIYKLRVRGAPALGVAAGYSLVTALKPFRDSPVKLFYQKAQLAAEVLNQARPTAVNLKWALDRMINHLQSEMGSNSISSRQLYESLVREAVLIENEDSELCRNIGTYGRPLIQEGMGILTHCNAGALATSRWGTATAPMYMAHEQGISFKVYSDETRPLLQGSRLTAWELSQAGLDVTVICDSMAASLMSQNRIQMVITGADRVAANGDTANKIGTLGVAVLAQYFGIDFYIACPGSTIDLNTLSGNQIPIEERPWQEITQWGERRTAPPDVTCWNPAFDITPHQLITGMITDRGIIYPPYKEHLQELFGS